MLGNPAEGNTWPQEHLPGGLGMAFKNHTSSDPKEAWWSRDAV